MLIWPLGGVVQFDVLKRARDAAEQKATEARLELLKKQAEAAQVCACLIPSALQGGPPRGSSLTDRTCSVLPSPCSSPPQAVESSNRNSERVKALQRDIRDRDLAFTEAAKRVALLEKQQEETFLKRFVEIEQQV